MDVWGKGVLGSANWGRRCAITCSGRSREVRVAGLKGRGWGREAGDEAKEGRWTEGLNVARPWSF